LITDAPRPSERNEPAGRGTILVVEPHLKGRHGHAWRYALAFVERLAPRGWSMRFLAHRDYTGPARLGGMPVEAVFLRSYYESADVAPDRVNSRPETVAQETSTLSRFARTVLDAIERESRSSGELRILVPTASIGILAELLAIPLLWRGVLPRTALMFHEEPGFFANWYRPLDLDVLSTRLAGSGWAGELRCFATNKNLAERLTALLGTHVEDAGDVFSDGEIDMMLSLTSPPSLDQLPAHERTLLEALIATRSAGARIAWCPGPIRRDKGASALHGIVRALGQNTAEFALVVQTRPGKNPGVDPRDIEALAGHPRVTLVRDVLSEAAYFALLAVTAIVLLPYDPNFYARRVSHVFQEAVLAGRPILAAAGMAAESEDWGAAAVFLSDWSSWPSAALSAIDHCSTAYARDRAPRELVDKFKRWHRMVYWLISTPAAAAARPAVLYIHPFRQTQAEADRCSEDLKKIAAHGFPVLELVAPSTHRNLISLQNRLAGSAAQLSACTPPPAGIRRAILKLALDWGWGGRPHSVFGGRMALPGVIVQARDRRGFALVIAAGWKDNERVIRRYLGLPAGVPMLVRDAIGKAGGGDSDWADKLGAALDRVGE
jgi:hypothetical protein